MFMHLNGSTTVLGRSYVIHQWLMLLYVLNPSYRASYTDIFVGPNEWDAFEGNPSVDLPPFKEFKKYMEKARNIVLSESLKSTSVEELHFKQASGSDIACVQNKAGNFCEEKSNIPVLDDPNIYFDPRISNIDDDKHIENEPSASCMHSNCEINYASPHLAFETGRIHPF